ncbi:hypothetical protein BE08_21325, partial [Sorangium cellulosum]
QGFEPDGQRGCAPILPDGACPAGQMAIPGDTACREVAPCGDGEYGSIPVDATTQFVNAAYAGADSDGTRARPWKRIQDGIDNARSGAIVAVAAGRYAEDLLVQSKRIRLWGRCPGLVEVVGTGAEIATVAISRSAASRSEVRSLAITGPELGLFTTGASDVLAEGVWIHDTGIEGLHVEDTLGPTSVAVRASLIEAAGELAVGLVGSETAIEATVVRNTQPGSDSYGMGIVTQPGAQGRATLDLRRSLVEQNRVVGIHILGSDATIEATVVRDTQPNRTGRFGRGLSIEHDPDTRERADVTVRASLLSHNHEFGVFVAASDATMEATVVRDTQPRNDETGGVGIEIEGDGRGGRAALAVRASLLENNHEAGVRIEGSDATLEGTVVRDTQPRRDGAFGRGIEVLSTRKERATLALRASLLERNHDTGVLAEGASADIETTVVRGTRPAGGGEDGIGIRVQGDRETGERSLLTLRTSLLEQNHYLGAHVLGSDATIEATVVRDTQPHGDGTAGHGVAIQAFPATGARAKATLRAVHLSRNHEVGVLVAGSDATIEATVVRDTQANRDGSGGYGVAIQHERGRSEVTIRASSVESNREFGVSVHASDATIEATVVRDTRSNREGAFGRGIGISDDLDTGERSKVTLRSSLVDENHDLGVLVSGSDATIEATIVRGTRPSSEGGLGRGVEIHAGRDTFARATALLRSSLVEHNHDNGVFVAGSDATVEATVVRDTQPGNVDGGSGIVIQDDLDASERSTLTMRASLVEHNHDTGVVILGSDATIEATVVRDTQPVDGEQRGHGVHIQDNDKTLERATAALRGVLVEQNHSFGVTIFRSDAAIEASVVRATQASGDGTRGDGVAVRSYGEPATATITSTVVESNARAGVSTFSAAVVLVSSAVRCNRLDLNGREEVENQPFTFDGSKDNVCGCEAPVSPCPVETATLSPPERLSPSEPLP